MAKNEIIYTNPYAFVRTDWNQPPIRKAPYWHNSFQKQARSGRMSFRITTKMPLFIKGPEGEQEDKQPREFCHFIIDEKPTYFIPASSLKGMIRSIVEAVGNGCYSQFSGSNGLWHKLPAPFKPCYKTDNLCIGCRLFGFISTKIKNTVFKGTAFFSDAKQSADSPPLTFENHSIRSIGTPRPWCSRLYLSDKDHISGRKFYYHHQNVIQYQKKARTELCRTIKSGAVFDFHVDFSNLHDEDFRVLLYSLVLENGMWHKIGYGKADGFGSIQIECREIIFNNPLLRYTTKQEHSVIYKESDLSLFIAEQRKEFVKQNKTPGTLLDLKKILSNTIKPGTIYEYDTYWNRKKRKKRERDRYYDEDNTGKYKKGKKWRTGDDDMTFTF